VGLGLASLLPYRTTRRLVGGVIGISRYKYKDVF